MPTITQCISRTDDIDANNPGVSNRTLIDQMDKKTFDKVYTSVNKVVDAAAKNPHGSGQLNQEAPDPELLTRLAAWKNQHGNLQGPEAKFSKSKNISNSSLDAYLQKQQFFQDNPDFADGWADRITEATNYGLKQVGAKVSHLTANKENELTLTPYQVASEGNNYMAIYKNALGKQTGTVWAFANSTNPPASDDLNLKINGQALQGLEGGKWLSLHLPETGVYTFTPSNNIANNPPNSNVFQNQTLFSLSQNPNLAGISSQLKSSGFSLQQDLAPAQIDQNALMEKLQQSIQDFGKVAGSTNAPTIRGDQLNIQSAASPRI